MTASKDTTDTVDPQTMFRTLDNIAGVLTMLTFSIEASVMSTRSSKISTASRRSTVITKCCGFIPIRLGCFILAYLNLLFNAIQTIVAITFTTDLALATGGFDQLIEYPYEIESSILVMEHLPEIQAMEKSFLNEVGLTLLVVVMFNISMLTVHIFCLVGLHKNKPGPVKMYISFAIGRFCLTLVALMFLVLYNPHGIEPIVCHVIGLGLTGYFVIVYYIYSRQLLSTYDNPVFGDDTPITNTSNIYVCNGKLLVSNDETLPTELSVPGNKIV